MEKVAFALDVEDGWPPVIIEHLWCERTGALLELKNAPFFVKGLARGDKFSGEPDPVNGCIFDFTVEQPSGHSLVWVIEQNGRTLAPYKPGLLLLDCSIEGFPAFKLHAIDVPATADNQAASAAMDRLEHLGFAIAFPVWRHEYPTDRS